MTSVEQRLSLQIKFKVFCLDIISSEKFNLLIFLLSLIMRQDFNPKSYNQTFIFILGKKKKFIKIYFM
jgi:hypothetical protein